MNFFGGAGVTSDPPFRDGLSNRVAEFLLEIPEVKSPGEPIQAGFAVRPPVLALGAKLLVGPTRM
jgi:hypothetical protein